MTTGPAHAPPARALTIAGSDSGGGAGIQADMRAFFACGVHGSTAVTAVTAQNSLQVSGVHELPAEFVTSQIDAVLADIGTDAVKTGMLAGADIIGAVSAALPMHDVGGDGRIPLVIDPVAASMNGDPLLAPDAIGQLRTLLGMATLATPNLDEVRLLTGHDVADRQGQRDAARALHALGPRWVLVKGGHMYDEPDCVDLLYDGAEFSELPGTRYPSRHTHGGGDTMASAITAALARGAGMREAVAFGKRFVAAAVAHSYPMGAGHGPVSGFWRLAPMGLPPEDGGG